SLTSPEHRRRAATSLVLGLAVALAGSTAYAVATIGQSHGGGNANVGPRAPSQSGHATSGMRGPNVDNAALDTMLGGTRTEWSAAIDGSSTAAGLELSTNTAVMAIGGFSGSDPVPTLSQFQQYVANHQVTYFIAPNNKAGGPGAFGDRQHSDITNWVTVTFTPMKVGSDTVYDLATPATQTHWMSGARISAEVRQRGRRDPQRHRAGRLHRQPKRRPLPRRGRRSRRRGLLLNAFDALLAPVAPHPRSTAARRWFHARDG